MLVAITAWPTLLDQSAYEGSMTDKPTLEYVWVYYDTNKQMGDEGHLMIFATGEAADKWIAENDPEGVAWSYPVRP